MIPPVWQTKIFSLEFFLKIQHVYGQKMIDPSSMTNQDLHLEFFLKILHMYGQKMIDPPVRQTRISPGMFLNSQHAHGQKMIDCPEWQTRNSPGIFFKESTCTW